jgi:hypothetical protein
MSSVSVRYIVETSRLRCVSGMAAIVRERLVILDGRVGFQNIPVAGC